MKDQYDRIKENASNQTELLSYLINDPSVYFKCSDIIRAEMFTGENRQLFDSFLAIVSENSSCDVMAISEKSGIPLENVIKVASYFQGAPIPVEGLISNLFEFMAREQLSKLAGFISNQVSAGTDHNLIVDQINRVIGALQLGNTASTINMHDAMTSLLKVIEANRKSEHPFSGIPTGMKIIDYHMGGFHPGDLVIIAGETSHGKTSLALSCMFNTSVMYGHPTGIISHEMTPGQLSGRLSSYATEISSKHILFGKLTDSEFQQFNAKISQLINSRIFIQDFIKRELSDTIASIRMMVMQHQVKYVVVENAGNINVKGKNDDETRTAEISKSLKSIAMELGITVILISHLSRERDGKKVQPSLNRLRHSGQLENDADVVIFVYRAELHNFEYFNDPSDPDGKKAEGMVKVYIAKGRNVGLSQSYMKFNEQLTRFSDAIDEELYQF